MYVSCSMRAHAMQNEFQVCCVFNIDLVYAGFHSNGTHSIDDAAVDDDDDNYIKCYEILIGMPTIMLSICIRDKYYSKLLYSHFNFHFQVLMIFRAFQLRYSCISIEIKGMFFFTSNGQTINK